MIIILSIGQNFPCKNFLCKKHFSSQKIARFFLRGLQTLLIFLMSHKRKINVYKIVNSYDTFTFYAVVAQLVRALVCGTRGRRFKSHQPYHFFFPNFSYSYVWRFVRRLKAALGGLFACELSRSRDLARMIFFKFRPKRNDTINNRLKYKWVK